MKRALCTLLVTLSLNLPAYAGFSLGQTRVIYNEKDRQTTLRLINSGTEEHYLVQSWVENEKNQSINDFLVTPPIFKFYPSSQNTLMIKTISDSFPEDRESLFYINVKAIPAIDNSVKNKISFATKSVIKLIYRPTKLDADDARNAWKKLAISKKSGYLSLTNPTPYIINFGYFYANKNVKEISYILPFSDKKIPLNKNEDPATVKYNVINDFGGASDFINQNI